MSRRKKPATRKVINENNHEIVEASEVLMPGSDLIDNEFHRQAYAMWSVLKDKGMRENEVDEETANRLEVSVKTVHAWKGKYKWKTLYAKRQRSIFEMIAAANMPEMEKISHAIFQNMQDTMTDLVAMSDDYRRKKIQYDEELEMFLETGEGKRPDPPKPPFRVSNLNELKMYTDLVKLFVPDTKSSDTPDMGEFTIEQLNAIIKLEDKNQSSLS